MKRASWLKGFQPVREPYWTPWRIRVGLPIALWSLVTAKHFTDLDAWKLADELESFVTRLLQRRAWADFELAKQINQSTSSAPSNIAEGFGRFAPNSFAYFLRIAIASEFETQNHLLKAAKHGYITSAERDEGLILVKRSSTAAIRLRRYVLSQKGKAKISCA